MSQAATTAASGYDDSPSAAAEWRELPSWDDFVRSAGKDPRRSRPLSTYASFVAHHLATVAVARDNAPWLHALKNRAHKSYMEQLGIDDGECRAIKMAEIVAHDGKLSHAELMRASNSFQLPLIIRGWFAGTAATRNWTPQWLAQQAGSIELPCVMRKSTKFNHDRVNMTLAEFCNHVMRGDPVYLSGDMNFLKPGSPLLKDLELDRLEQGTQDSFDMTRVYVFGGLSLGTGTAMHCGEYASTFYVVAGHKRWRMLRPDYTPVMNPVASKFYSRLILAEGLDGAEKIEDHNRYWKQYQAFPHYVGDTHPGDLIVVPGWWWHHVENLGSGFTLGVDLDTTYHYPEQNKLLTYTCRTDLSPIRRRWSPWEKNRLSRQGVS